MTTPRLIPAARNAPANVEVAFRWAYDELASSRTLARNFLAFHVEIPHGLLGFAEKLLAYSDNKLYPSTGIAVIDEYADRRYNFSHKDAKDIASSVCTKALAALTKEAVVVELATCREQCFHHDEVLSEQHAYLALVLAQTEPLAFHSMGACLDLQVGDLLVFDAQHPHALIRQGEDKYQDVEESDLSHRFVFALGAVPLTQQLRKLLAMRVKKPSDISKYMRYVEYSEETGQFA